MAQAINHFFDRLFAKVPGYVFGLACVVIGMGGVFAAFLWQNYYQPITITKFWISNIGAGIDAGPGHPTDMPGSNILFNTCIVISAVLAVPFFVFFLQKTVRVPVRPNLKQNVLVAVAFAASMVSMGAQVTVGLFDMFANPTVHVIAAFCLFFGGVAYLMLWSVAFWRAGQKSRLLLGVALYEVVMMVVFLTVGYYGGVAYGLNLSSVTLAQMVSFMSTMTSAADGVRLMEWITLPGLFIWVFLCAVLARKHLK
jgi:hypothetical protein